LAGSSPYIDRTHLAILPATAASPPLTVLWSSFDAVDLDLAALRQERGELRLGVGLALVLLGHFLERGAVLLLVHGVALEAAVGLRGCLVGGGEAGGRERGGEGDGDEQFLHGGDLLDLWTDGGAILPQTRRAHACPSTPDARDPLTC